MTKLFQQRSQRAAPKRQSAAPRRGAAPRRSPVAIAGIAGIVVLALFVVSLGFLWGIAMPVRDLPEPTGPYTVGTVSYDLVDSSRPDPYRLPGSSAPESRTVRLQLWYPAAPSFAARAEAGTTDRAEDPAPWMADGPKHTRAIVRSHGFPFFIWEHTRWMDSNSYRAVPAAGPSSYPVAIIVHGWEGYRGLHADIAEELASHGYLVAAANHSYGAAATRLSDGTLLYSRDDVLPERDSTDHFARSATELVETFSRDIGTIREHLADIAGGGAHIGSAPAEEERAVGAALAQLESRIDLEQLVLVGHSTGGGAAVHHTLEEAGGAGRRTLEEAGGAARHTQDQGTVSAIVGLDAWVEPLGHARLAEAELTVPTLFLRSEEWIGGINDSYLVPFVERLQAAGAPVELRQMEGITHEQFSTLYMYAPATRWMGLLGDADPWEFARVQRTTIREFLIESGR
ncbi:MAG: hypothetical protein R6U25_12610 [Alkalispirochaeta sp.]